MLIEDRLPDYEKCRWLQTLTLTLKLKKKHLVSLKWPKMLGFVPLEKETRSISVQKRHGGDLQGTGDADEKIEVVATGCELGHHHPLKEQFTVDE